MSSPMDFAMNLIRAPFVQKIKDRTFQVLIVTAVSATSAVIAAFQSGSMGGTEKMYVLFGALGAWSYVGAAFTKGDKAKDAAIFAAAANMMSSTPATVNAGGDVTVNPPPQIEAEKLPSIQSMPTFNDLSAEDSRSKALDDVDNIIASKVEAATERAMDKMVGMLTKVK